jgi:hypothetical protein
MGAKRKLNKIAITGAVITAAAVAFLAGSPLVFLVALAVLVAAAYHAGDIRD